ncbi:ubiquitin-conjugating enzyme E2 T-like [Saccostrea echinata]|uniref:ubiquitin-conjugating enzyme E2 T-like n=1 Tax=Saccostrea echinata TaxID=191078 RepID=UPI002A818325|nr:ubiquitin-conjugating enzyme E2 T-like [Saccostrea echinata]
MQRILRMKKELEMFSQSPPHGVSCWSNDEDITQLSAQVLGGEGTPYEGGIFKLEVQIPDRYPFEPPKVKFLTPIYHPNIDSGGRICLDTLKMPPKGAWKPCLNVSTVLTSVQLLMAEPNPEDPLMTDISNEYQYNRATYIQTAKDWTRKYAMEEVIQATKSTDLRKEDSPLGPERVKPLSEKTKDLKRSHSPQPMEDLTNKLSRQ